MLTHPHPGQRVRLRYREPARAHCPHDRAGVVEIVGTGKPRNHGVRLDDGRLVVVPCGQLMPSAYRWAPNPCGCGGCSVCGFYGLAPKPVVVPAEPPVVLRAFGTLELREAQAFAAAGHQALHLHNVIVDRRKAPRCFVRDVDAGRPIAHLLDRDAARLERTARGFGVKVVVVERAGQPGQHIDLCGAPLAKALAAVDNPAEATALAAAFAEDAKATRSAKTLFDEVEE